MAGMSSLVRIVNAGVPGSQDRVDVVLRDGVVASVGPAGTVSASDSTMQTKAHTTSLEYATNAIASGSVSIPTSAAAPADETTIDADGLWVIPGLWDCHTHFTQWAKTLGRLDLINARSASEAMDMLTVIWMSAAPPTRLTQMPSWWACDSVTRCGPTTSSPHWPQLTP